jgi:hypothetical protein
MLGDVDVVKVIRCGRRPTPNTGRWSDAETLKAFWDLEEQVTGRPGPMKRQVQALNIPELKITLPEKGQGNG